MIVYDEADCKIYRITLPTYTLVGLVHLYLYEDKDGLLLIDAGIKNEESWQTFQQSAESAGFSIDRIRAIFITHHHSDHTDGLRTFLRDLNVPVYAHPDSIPWMNQDVVFLQRRLDFLGKMYEEAGCGSLGEQYVQAAREKLEQQAAGPNVNVTAVQDGAMAGPFTVMETPGHAPDHLLFYHPEKQLAFSGDTLLLGHSTNAIVEPDRSGNRLLTLVQYLRSLEKMQRLGSVRFFPGHGEMFTDAAPHVVRVLQRIEGKADRVMKLLADGPLCALDIAKKFYPDRYERRFYLIMSDVIGLLDYMESAGRLRKEAAGSGVCYYHAV